MTHSNTLSILALAATALFAMSDVAFAQKVVLQGTHSKQQILEACGLLREGNYVENGKGYRCTNDSNGASVDCDNSGHCTGDTTDEQPH